MSINCNNYNGKSTLLKLKRLMSSSNTVKSSKKDSKDRIGFVHQIKQTIRDKSGQELMSNSFVNVIMSNSESNYENIVISSYRISDTYNIDKTNGVIKITSRNKLGYMESVVTLLEKK